ncbi:hypothetical protein [Armatimonas rosea]|uniref:HEAT repeat protein n=1 Tax=Armatimonas rosea TaxID=685828 RepID=A0A7W9SUZ0_ARMRO|nr:hypothetical protein [Armatimonas rosea]MBB6052840.1 hypothetical protein [Armatimonas rosea]
MTRETLLAELETLTHGARLRRLYNLGRESVTNPETQALLETLSQGETVYERTLALSACWGSGDARLAERARTDRSRAVRRLALDVLVRFGSDEAVLAAVQALPQRKVRLRYLQVLAKAKRTEVIERILTEWQAAGDSEIARFLAYTSPAFVENLLPTLAERLTPVESARLAARHPELLTRTLLSRIAATPGRDYLLLGLCRAALTPLAHCRPELALALVTALRATFPLGTIGLPKALIHRCPQDIVALALATDEPLSFSFVAIADSLESAQLVALVQKHPHTLPLWCGLGALAPEKRRALYAACGLGWRGAGGELPLALVQTLPDASLRHAEARRCWGLSSLATVPEQRIPYAGVLPWDEAQTLLEPFLNNPDATLRGLALTALCGAAGYDEEALPALLTLFSARAFEQDPVRQAMLAGLAKIPLGRWQAGHLEALAQILAQARSASDLSLASATHAVALVTKLLARFPEWAAPELAIWVRTRGHLDLAPLVESLSAKELATLEPHLLPVLRSWKTRESEHYLVRASVGLSTRLRQLPGTVALLEELLHDSVNGYTAAHLLTLLGQTVRERFRVLVPALLERDKSWITQRSVWEFLHRQRQDLLTDEFLGRRAFSGRFSTGKTRFVLPVRSHFGRWTPRQQGLFAQTLAEVLVDSERPNPEAFQAVKQYAALVDVALAPLVELAQEKAQNLALRDTALRALALLDSSQGTAELVAALDDSRARVAIYALRSVVLELPLTRSLALLRETPRRKITVAKEVIRLLGDLSQSAGLADLLTWAAEPNLHRDLRVALVRALWAHREHEATWLVLRQALESGDAALATIALRAPNDGLSASALRRQLELLVLGLRHPDPLVRLQALGIAQGMPNLDGLLTEPILERLNSSLFGEYTVAAFALIRVVGTEHPEAAAIAIRQTLPQRRVLPHVVESLCSVLRSEHPRYQAAGRAALEALRTDPLTGKFQTMLALTALEGEELVAWLERNVPEGENLAWSIAQFEVPPRQPGRAELRALLSVHPHPTLRRLGLAALIGETRGSAGWTDEARAALARFCQDEHSLVAAAAQFTFPPETG